MFKKLIFKCKLCFQFYIKKNTFFTLISAKKSKNSVDLFNEISPLISTLQNIKKGLKILLLNPSFLSCKNQIFAFG